MSPLTLTNLRVNDIVDPIATSATPYFGWHLHHSESDQIQTRYHVLVASSKDNLDRGIGDVWDSGEVQSRMQNHINYDGSTLTSNTKYFWKVRAWDKHDSASAHSATATFITELLTNDDWSGAKWIKRDTMDEDDYTYYRKTIALPSKIIRRATVFVSSVHKYELYLNGFLIGTGPSYHYPQHQYYNAYDITTHCISGANNVFAVLNHWFGGGQGRPASAHGLIIKAVIEHIDGDRTLIVTDATWKQKRAECWVSGQPSRNDEGVGYIEKIDAAKLIPDWFSPALDDSSWQPATEIGPHPTPPWIGNLYPDLTHIVEREIAPVSIVDKGNGKYVVDLGKVYAGRPRIIFSGGSNATLISMRGGYTLSGNGEIDISTWQNTDISYYAVDNGDTFVFLPHEYLGMRYFQIDNAPMPIDTSNFSFIERHSALDESRSMFTSSDSTLNAVWDLMKRSCELGVQEQFLDTPTREKGGFLVDSLNESLVTMSAYGERVLTLKVLNEFLHSTDQYWSSDAHRGRMNAVYPNGDGARDIPDFTQAYLLWVWEYYMHTGDKKFLADNYSKLKNIADYVHRHRDAATGLIYRLSGGGTSSYQHGIIDWPPSMRYGYDMATDTRTVINALAYADYDLVSRMANELDRADDRDKYRAMANDIRSAINSKLISTANVYIDGLYTDGEQSAHASQQANMLPLALGIVSKDKRASVIEHVKALKMRCGMVTVLWLIRALGEMDEGEHLIDLYTRSDWDGWAQSLAKGATRTWESWDADSGGNLSQSHPWGAVGLCGIQQYILGVKPLLPQYQRVQIKPLDFGDRLKHAVGKLPTDRGEIVVDWDRDERRFFMMLTLPVNMQAKVYLPKGHRSDATIIIDGISVNGIAESNTIAIGEIGSGTHTFERAIA